MMLRIRRTNDKYLKFYIPCIYIFLISFLVGCGYSMRTLLPSNYKSIYISPFENKIDISERVSGTKRYKTYRHMLEREITSAVIDRFIYDSDLEVRDRKKDVDLILEGELIEYRKDPLRYTKDDEVEEYRLSLIVDISLVDGVTNEPIIEERVIGDASYFVLGQLSSSIDTGVNLAISDLARRIVEHVVERW